MASKRTRRRDYAAEYRRRQERARARGFSSYYEERVRGGAKATPATAKPSGERLRRARGHASRRDLERELRPGAMVEVTDHERDAKGRVTRLVLLVTDEDGTERDYVLRGRSLDVDGLLRLVDERDAIDSPRYGLRSLFAHAEEDLDLKEAA